MGGASWSLFFAYRKYFIESDKFGYQIPVELDGNFYAALVLIPVYWIGLYFMAGQYKDVWRKSRISEISQTFTVTVVGVILLFFALLLDDAVSSYQSYYKSILILFVLHFGFTVITRLLVASWVKYKLRKKHIGFNTLVVGNNQKSFQLVRELMAEKVTQGNIFKGFVSINGDANDHILKDILPNLGHYKLLPELIVKHEIEEVIIGIDSSQHADINKVTDVLEDQQVVLKIIPDVFDLMSGTVRMSNV
jgi:FlaA1/EpsC-like NDP-sugar epimerase